ncbi:MAG: SphA family protein [Methyloceanibacter sp.]|uniref:SphA family protein n=1 Tax=Methyloceanibacter sp. TaxID=1965321 RepID=UPI003D6CD612
MRENWRFSAIIVVFLSVLAVPVRALAVEGPTVAGPIGGTDIRSAIMPLPGLYGGFITVGAGTIDFLDRHGETIPALRDAQLYKELVGPFLYYVPNFKVFGGSVGFGGIIPGGNQCGSLFIGQRDRCNQGVGDPYVEFDWGRYYGTPRPSRNPNAYPILEGLNLMLGFGMVIPSGQYDNADTLARVLSMGTNIWDFAPSIALTYTTRPILAEGTEFSAKAYYNTYLENPETHYLTGDLINIDWAVSEHIGRFQVGVAGFYAIQIGDDEFFGVPIPPDGLRAETLQLGPVIGYDIPEHATSMKLKALTSAFAYNTVTAWSVVFGVFKKF